MRKFKHIKLLAAAIGVALLTLAVPAEAITLKPTNEMDSPAILADKTGTVYVVVQFDVPELDFIRSQHRPDLSLAIVIDRSGSMADRGKLEYARTAAQDLIDRLN